MIDMLKTLCKILNIELSYTNNKVTILSCGSKNKYLLIRAHKIFKECNEDIACAIIDYYVKAENREDNIKIIKSYANKKFGSPKYKIIPPNNKRYDEIAKAIMQEDSAQNQNTSLVELDISSISKENFHGDAHTVNPNEPLKVAEDDILEVNIIVKPFNT